MKYRRRIYYSAAQRELMWDRWRRGDSMGEIGRLFDRAHTSVQKVLAATGGIRPPPRKLSRLALSLAEREEISRGPVSFSDPQFIPPVGATFPASVHFAPVE